ncbi:hypothetical protein [Streptomyces hypolithicus]
MAVPLWFFRSMTAERLRAEGRWHGRAKIRRERLMEMLAYRGIELSDEARERVTACTDPCLLRTWFLRAVTATSAEELFADE